MTPEGRCGNPYAGLCGVRLGRSANLSCGVRFVVNNFAEDESERSQRPTLAVDLEGNDDGHALKQHSDLNGGRVRHRGQIINTSHKYRPWVKHANLRTTTNFIL